MEHVRQDAINVIDGGVDICKRPECEESDATESGNEPTEVYHGEAPLLPVGRDWKGREFIGERRRMQAVQARSVSRATSASGREVATLDVVATFE